MAVRIPMKQERCIDVIIPSYNGMPFLIETVESVLNQSHENLKLYLVDDGSTDNGKTRDYIKSLKDDRVHYLNKVNGGQASARNLGIRASDSPYITFLDSDDVWRPNKLREQLELLVSAPSVGLVYGLCTVIDENGKLIRKVSEHKEGNLYHYLMGGNRITGSASMVMIKRSVIDAIGPFREDFLIAEDWEMWLRVARDYEIRCVPKYIADLRALTSGMQTNHLRMANGFQHMLPIMLREFKPNLVDRAKFGGYCLGEATLHYYQNGDTRLAKATLLRLLGYNPFYFLKYNPGVWVACIQIIISNEPLRKFRRKTSRKYREREREAKEKI